MNKYSKEDVIRMVREQDVNFIRMQFTDIFGQMKNLAITSSQMEKALDNKLTIDGSSIEGFTRIHESDQYLYPDLDTFSPVAWSTGHGKVARMFCDVYNPDESPFVGDPRYVLKQMLAKAKEKGYTFNVGPECEFFLFDLDKDGAPTTNTRDEASYFDLGPTDHGEATRREACLALEALGFEIEASHHEVAAGQHEIDFKYADALRSADNIMTFKQTVKALAHRNGLHATFMPKPLYGVSGSGMHTNMSLFKDGKNIFFDPSDSRKLSREAYNFIAGLLTHMKAITAITNPLVNSYKRLVPGYEAPCYLAWSASNRSALIRIPAARGQSTRVELRSPDPSCNPYLALAVCLAAGLDGIEKDLMPPEEITENIYDMDDNSREAHGIEDLPNSLSAAIKELKKDQLIIDTLGSHVFTQFVAGKENEWKEYRTRISNWEIENYLVQY
jgi:glutamine synthetase